VDCLTKPKFFRKLIVILAGYSNDINKLLTTNEGLTSRFTETVEFSPLTPQHCLELLEQELKKNNIICSSINDPAARANLLHMLRELSTLPFWGNARDVQTLAKNMANLVFSRIIGATDSRSLPIADVLSCIERMLLTRRVKPGKGLESTQTYPQASQAQECRPPDSAPTNTCTKSDAASAESDSDGKSLPPPRPTDSRDAGVSDKIWDQLEADKRAIQLKQERFERALELEKQALQDAEEAEKRLKAEEEAFRQARAKDEEEARELNRQREEARIRSLEAKTARQKHEEETRRLQLKEREKKRKEAAVQVKLREMGVCVMGYQWIKQAGGYRCAGGSHFMSNAALGI